MPPRSRGSRRWLRTALPAHPTCPPVSGGAGRLPSAAALLRRRRSAVAFDGRTPAEAAALYRLLGRLSPCRRGTCCRGGPTSTSALFLHRDRDLVPGLYLLARDPAAESPLRAACRPTFRWERPAGCPDHLPLYLLREGDLRERASALSCRQELAADGAFSLGMVAEFGDVIRRDGPWWYRRLFWEAGAVGQALYLEAEAAGLRGTGIGCYFDDATHDLLGLVGDRFQVLYHFAVGAPVEDARRRPLAPYAHLTDR